MFLKCLFIKLLLISIVHFSCNQLYAQEKEGGIIPISEGELKSERTQQTVSSASKEKKVYFTIRLGQGEFRDDRSDIGKLGGGQLTLDIKPRKYPVAISISGEYYTNSPDPTHSYEIAHNLLYMTKLFKKARGQMFLWEEALVGSKFQKVKMSQTLW